MKKKPTNKGENASLEALHKADMSDAEVEKYLCEKRLRRFYDFCNNETDTENNILGKRIAYIRGFKKINAQALAERCGINRSTLNRIENGKAKGLPRFSTVVDIVNALDIQVEDFTCYVDSEKMWKEHINSKYGLYDITGGFEIIENMADYEDVRANILNMIDSIIIKAEKGGRTIRLSSRDKDLLKTSIFNSFETVKTWLFM